MEGFVNIIMVNVIIFGCKFKNIIVYLMVINEFYIVVVNVFSVMELNKILFVFGIFNFIILFFIKKFWFIGNFGIFWEEIWLLKYLYFLFISSVREIKFD